jgi:hypothetical protein
MVGKIYCTNQGKRDYSYLLFIMLTILYAFVYLGVYKKPEGRVILGKLSLLPKGLYYYGYELNSLRPFRGWDWAKLYEILGLTHKKKDLKI